MRRTVAILSILFFLAGPVYSECNPPASILAACSSSSSNASSNSSIKLDPKISSSLVIIGVTVLIGVALFYYLKSGAFQSRSVLVYNETSLDKSLENPSAAADFFADTHERLVRPFDVGFQNWGFNLPGFRW